MPMDMAMEVDLTISPEPASACSSDAADSLVLTRFSSDCTPMLKDGVEEQEQGQERSVLAPHSDCSPTARHHGFRDMPRHKPRQRHPLRRARTHEDPLLRQLLLHLHWKKQEELRCQESMERTQEDSERFQRLPPLESVCEHAGDMWCHGSACEAAAEMSIDEAIEGVKQPVNGGFEVCWETILSSEAQHGVPRSLDLASWPQVQEDPLPSASHPAQVGSSKDCWELQVRQPELAAKSTNAGLPYFPSLSPFWGPTTFLGEQGQIFLGPPSSIPASHPTTSSKLQEVSLPLSFLSQYSQGLGDNFLFEESSATPFSIEEFEKNHLSRYLPQLELF